MEKKELFIKINQEIIKSGFPLEIYCRKKLLENGWGVTNSQYFKDSENNYKEIDGEGHLQSNWKNKNGESNLFSNLFLECKKSDNKQWVFFNENLFGQELNYKSNSKRINQLLHVELYNIKEKPHYFKVNNAAQNYMIPFCKPNSTEHRQIYESINNLINYYDWRDKLVNNIEKSNQNEVYTDLFFLAVIFDGVIIMAKPTKNGFNLKEVSHLVVNVHKRSLEKGNNYTVDIVKKEYFSKYLSIIKKDHAIVESFLKSMSL